MRTTLILNDDVSAKLRAEARRLDKPFKQVVNDYLRIGLNVRTQAPPVPPFVVTARALGNKGFDYDNIEELLDEIEGPFRR